ncbi:MAG TPA: PQQ-binding-like beta-propeller repeat protein, partial [Candidatus Saccharimonadia bacterium]|nr:PQQ-binding-like beta-propeller repeat protein [Candidatus Saccharimonadia bacterium]
VVRAHDGRVFGFAAGDGARRWVLDRGVPLLSLRGNSAPLISGQTVYVGYDNGKAVALDLETGAMKWEQAIAQSEGRTELERLVDIDGEVAGTNGEIFAVTYRGQVGAIAVDSGRQGWSRDMSSYGGLALSGDSLYVTDADGSVFALDARSGASLWQQDALAHRWLSTPAVAGGHVVVGDFEGYVHVLSAEDGSIAARTRVGDEAINATPLAVGDTVYISNTDGSLAAIKIGG